MKTIIIPKRFGYPTTEITINGRGYPLQSGVEISVEDSVAEAIENAIALAPKHDRYLSKLAQHLGGSLTEILAEDMDGVASIYPYALYNNKSVTRIVFADSVTVIEGAAFFGCSSLESIEFGGDSKIDTIKSNAFNGCTNLKKVYLPEVPPILASSSAFTDINSACVFYCKTPASLEAYKKAENWSTLTGTYTFVVEGKNG